MERNRLPWVEIGITLAGIVVLAVLAIAIDPLHEAVKAALQGDNAEVRHQIDRLGAAGPLLILVLTLLHAIVFYPAEIVDAAAGFAYGFFPALALMTVGWVLSGLLCWAVGHRVARPLLDRWFGVERFQRVEGAIERGGPTLLLAMRLVPILPFSIVSYAAGAAHVPLWRFIWTTALGYLPITAIAVYFGTRLEGLSLTDPLVLGSAAALLALLAIGHWVMRRQSRRQAGTRPARSAETSADADVPDPKAEGSRGRVGETG
ncbi:MAG TPA: VTT domain-containing protein [Solirubrobacterales bacterium]|nr:VTT domain-containing protein [Solirubrobacterales bacterium]